MIAPFEFRKSTLQFVCICSFFLNACTVVKETGFEHFRSDIGVNLNNTNINYQYDGAYLFKDSINKQLDNFDELYTQSLFNKLFMSGYKLNSKTQLININLENCLIDIKKTEPQAYPYNGDTLQISKLNTTLMCSEKNSPKQIFYSNYSTFNEFEAIPIKMADRAGFSGNGFQSASTYLYREIPNSSKTTNSIASHLAGNTFQKIDTLAKQQFAVKFPAENSRQYTRTQNAEEASSIIFKIFLLALMAAIVVAVQP